MREILFKAKTEKIVRPYNNGLDDGIWVQGYLRCDCGMWLIYQFEYDRADQVAYEVNPETICQYTGLTDKNGNKIWENDIVCTPYVDPVFGDMVNNVILDDYLWKVGFEYGCFCVFNESFCIKLVDFTKERNIKVVSNIFDNPELLENE